MNEFDIEFNSNSTYIKYDYKEIKSIKISKL
jgi:hypothetical protein